MVEFKYIPLKASQIEQVDSNETENAGLDDPDSKTAAPESGQHTKLC
jgi:hypothetical protein